jgi:hypothetical protein
MVDVLFKIKDLTVLLRVVSGVQFLISACLFAICVLTYFS